MNEPSQNIKQAWLDMARTFPFFNLIGLDVLDMEPGWSLTKLAFREDLCQPAGIMHGGVISSLIDTGIAHALILTEAFQQALAQGGGIVSVDLRVKFFRPVSQGEIFCESRIIRQGKTLIHAESIVRDSADKEVARGDSIYTTVIAQQLGR